MVIWTPAPILSVMTGSQMGKKKEKKEKKVSGAVKTLQKTQKNAEKKAKKELRDAGEKDIDEILAEIQEQDRKKNEVKEVPCGPPSPRCNMSLTAHPDREELIMFGGEHDTGNKTYVYNDMFIYNLKNNQWSQLITPNPPPPRCSHQAVAVRQGGGQLWLFGGEFASPTQSQFHHWKDLWVFSLKDRLWQKVSAPGGPSSRSGHRMVAIKKQLLVFGGFHDNLRECRYFNDVYSFNLETYQWSQVIPKGQGPSPRSNCQMLVNSDQSGVVIYGGYSKEKTKKDVEIGKTHSDMFALISVQKSGEDEEYWKWQPMKQTGTRPSPRCGMTGLTLPGGSAFFFGGVFDEAEDEEDVQGVFYNEMYTLETDKGKWHTVWLKGVREGEEKKRRRRKKEAGDGDEEEEMEVDGAKMEVDGAPVEQSTADRTENTTAEPMEAEQGSSAMDTKDPPKEEAAAEPESITKVSEDGIFTVTLGGPSSSQTDEEPKVGDSVRNHGPNSVIPSPRMNPIMTFKHSCVYLYGGIYEEGDRQVTYDDLYVLDVRKQDNWAVLVKGNAAAQKWEESGSSESESEDSEDEDGDQEDEEMLGAVGGHG